MLFLMTGMGMDIGPKTIKLFREALATLRL